MRHVPAGLTAVVLCGGRGTRAWPLTDELPKPLLVVGDRPALGHVLEIFSRQGVDRFVLAAGFHADRVREWADRSPYNAHTLDTGLDTNTGGRVRACLDSVGERFLVTYGDGLGDINLAKLIETHEKSSGATVTTVPLRSQYGTVETDDCKRVIGFREKPILQDYRINAGFFVFERDTYQRYGGEDLEREVLPAMASDGILQAYEHSGFWRSMDTQKDVSELNELATKGAPPWLPLNSVPTRDC